MKKRVLFLCTHNSARSQISEAWLKSLYPDNYEAFSAGTHPTKVHPLAVKVMSEKNIDISSQKSKSFELFLNKSFAYVVTLCNSAQEACPVFPGDSIRLHYDFTDPTSGSKSKQLFRFRKVRDEIREFIVAEFRVL